MRITVRESLISKMSRKLCDCWALPVLCCILVLGVPVCSSPQFPSARMRRASSQVTYEVDTLVVVDREFYTKWVSSHGGLTLSTESDIKEYVSLMVRQANVRLSNLQDRLNYNVAINVVAFQINVNVLAGIQPNIVTRSVSAEDALNSFFVWVSGNSLSGTYDHFILLTGFQLRDEYESHQLVSGRAYVGTLCNPSGRSLSVVHDLGGLQGAHTMAHELAHCLGSFHDGEASRNSCSKENRYIMAADDTAPRTPANQDHPWYFSTCSASAIDDFLHDIVLAAGGNDCLAQTSGPAPEFAATLTTVPGQRYVAHTQCQMIHGPQSRLCLGGSFGEISDICTSMYCLNPSVGSTARCSRYAAAEGTSCGSKKWCRVGRCVESVDAPEMPVSECPYGDRVVTIEGRYSCSEYIAVQKNACYDENIRANCCDSCLKAKSSSEVCPWGDRVDGCTPGVCELIQPDGTQLSRQCCSTCDYVTERKCVDGSMSGVSCDVIVSQGATQPCYNPTVAYHCCASCTALRTAVAGCEYGDRSRLCGSKESCEGQQAEQCCATCSGNSTNRAPDFFGTGGGYNRIVPVVVLAGILHLFCWGLVEL